MKNYHIGFQQFLDAAKIPASTQKHWEFRAVARIFYSIWWIREEIRRRRFVRDMHRMLDDFEREYEGGVWSR